MMESPVMMATNTTPPDEDFDLEEPSLDKPDVDQVKMKLYQRECDKLGIIPVGAFMRAPSQAEISIRHYGLGPIGAGALSVPLMLDSFMTSLDLEGNAIGGEGLANMAEMLLDHCCLAYLNLRNNNLGSRGASLICQVLESNKLLVSVNLSTNNFVDTDGVVFANMLKVNKTLKSLNLSDNKFSHVAGTFLGDALSQNETLEALDLSWNQFREGGASQLLEGVKENIGLKTLSLAFNAFNRGSMRMSPLGSAMSGNSTLRSIDVSNNRLCDRDLFILAKALKENEVLESLMIGHNLVSYRGAGMLVRAVIANNFSRMKLLDMTNLPIAEIDIGDIETLRSRGIKVVHGSVHQNETRFDGDLRSVLPNKKSTGRLRINQSKTSGRPEGFDASGFDRKQADKKKGKGT